MKRYFLVTLFFLSAIFSLQQATAQTADSTPVKRYRVGVFAPLYLDSVFSVAGNFRFKEGMPKFIVPAVDFINGVQAGLDSFKTEHENVDVYIYDTKSYTQPLSSLIRNKKLDSLDLLIGAVRDFEYKYLANLALAKHIPFISASYPNDGGVTENPFVVILNSTLKAHCEAIYSYLLQNHGTNKIFLCRRTGQQEDRVAGYFKAINEQDGKPLLNIQTINVDSAFTAATLKPKLDSNRHTVVIGASLDEGFANSLTAACYEFYEKYPLTLIGMPNWDGFKSLVKKDAYDDFPIFYTTPYFNTKNDENSKVVINAFAAKLKGKPSDMAFKGFECAQVFIKMLTKYPGDFMSHLNDKTFKMYSEYNLKPVMLKKTGTVPDYFENKHLFFVRILNGNLFKAW
ncbi:MAG: ABC transporter substrate-binding protein [Ferruginibacter sp.]